MNAAQKSIRSDSTLSAAVQDGVPILRFLLRQGGVEHRLALTNGEVVHIGRASTNAVVLEDGSVSGHHVELSVSASSTDKQLSLWARDRSRNGTGIVSVSGLTSKKETRRLSSEAAEELIDGMELVVPLRCKPGMQERQRFRFVVQLTLNTDAPLPLAHHKVPANECEAAPLSSQESAAVAVVPMSLDATAGVAPVLSAERHDEVVCDASGPVANAPAKPNTLDILGLPDVFDPAEGLGRWRYEARIGEGGLGVVYRVTDCKAGRGEVAVKILKQHARIPRRNARHAFAMHRESQWSVQWLHNQNDARYVESSAGLFAKYLEDHTGFSELEPASFTEKRRFFEAPGFDWNKDGPALPLPAYVVMELVVGESLQTAIDRERRHLHGVGDDQPPVLSIDEKRAVVVDATRALEYLSRFNLIHRDFRGCVLSWLQHAPRGTPET